MSSPPPSPLLNADAAAHSLRAAIIALQERRASAAEELAAEVLKAEPSHVVAAQILGEALLLQNRPRDAIAILQDVTLRTKDPGAETLLAMALTADGRTDAAVTQLRRAITRRPVFPLAFIELGERLSAQGSYGAAAAVLERGLGLAPESDALRLSLGYLYLKANARGKAKTLFRAILARSPDAHSALSAMAKALALDGEYAEAALYFRRSLALRPDDAAGALGLGKCLLETGARAEGEAILRSAAQAEKRMIGPALLALSSPSRGRLFARVSQALRFMGA